MEKKLVDCQKEIFSKNKSKEKYEQIKKEVESIWKSATQDEKDDFEESGAGDMLYQALEYM